MTGSENSCRVSVTFLGPIRTFTGQTFREIQLSKKESNVRGLVNAFAETYGDQFASLFVHGLKSNRGVRVFVDGVNILAEQDLDTKLHDSSEVEIVLASQSPGG